MSVILIHIDFFPRSFFVLFCAFLRFSLFSSTSFGTSKLRFVEKKNPKRQEKWSTFWRLFKFYIIFFLGVVNVERFCSDTWASVLTMPSALLYYQFNFLVKYFSSFPPVLFTSRILSILLYEPTKKTEFTNSSPKRKFSIEIINRRKKLHFGREFSCVYCVIKHRIITSVMCTNDPMPFIISVNTKIQNNTTKYSTNKLNSSITFSLVFVVFVRFSFWRKIFKSRNSACVSFFFYLVYHLTSPICNRKIPLGLAFLFLFYSLNDRKFVIDVVCRPARSDEQEIRLRPMTNDFNQNASGILLFCVCCCTFLSIEIMLSKRERQMRSMKMLISSGKFVWNWMISMKINYVVKIT